MSTILPFSDPHEYRKFKALKAVLAFEKPSLFRFPKWFWGSQSKIKVINVGYRLVWGYTIVSTDSKIILYFGNV